MSVSGTWSFHKKMRYKFIKGQVYQGSSLPRVKFTKGQVYQGSSLLGSSLLGSTSGTHSRCFCEFREFSVGVENVLKEFEQKVREFVIKGMKIPQCEWLRGQGEIVRGLQMVSREILLSSKKIVILLLKFKVISVSPPPHPGLHVTIL